MSASSVAPARSVTARAALVLAVTLLAHGFVVERMDRLLAGARTEEPNEDVTVTARLLPPPAPPAPPPPAPRPAPRPRAAPAVAPAPAAEAARVEAPPIGDFGEPLAAVGHDYGAFAIRLHPFRCRITTGDPQPHEHAEIRWVEAGEIDALAWAAADVPVLGQWRNL